MGACHRASVCPEEAQFRPAFPRGKQAPKGDIKHPRKECPTPLLCPSRWSTEAPPGRIVYKTGPLREMNSSWCIRQGEQEDQETDERRHTTPPQGRAAARRRGDDG